MTSAGRPLRGSVADSTGNWVDEDAPQWARPYFQLMRADRPIGAWLLLLPCWWSTALAAVARREPPDLKLIVLFAIGAIVMRGAGCTWNDILDRDLDKKVERTRSRPIPAGDVSVTGAFVFLAALSLAGLAVLLQVNGFAIVTGIVSLGVVALYPLAKRITDWPQAVLGLAFSWGALMGWAAVFGRLDPPAYLLYAGSILWVIGYDTIYAHQDREDDAIVGVRSTARLFGKQTKSALSLFFAGAVVLITAAVVAAGGGIYSLVGVAAFGAHLAWQVRTIDIDDPRLCLKLFRANRDAGLLLFAGLVLDALFSAPGALVIPGR
jgi:4-hydroxybenzoate polyprenyltransferase